MLFSWTDIIRQTTHGRPMPPTKEGEAPTTWGILGIPGPEVKWLDLSPHLSLSLSPKGCRAKDEDVVSQRLHSMTYYESNSLSSTPYTTLRPRCALPFWTRVTSVTSVRWDIKDGTYTLQLGEGRGGGVGGGASQQRRWISECHF